MDATSADTVINALADTGSMLGVSDNMPTSWTGSTPSQPVLPAGFTGGGYRSFNAAGDLAGSLFLVASPPTGAVPFVQTSNGEIQVFDPPAGNAPDWVGRLQVFALDESLSFVAVARGETDLFGQAYRYADGQQIQLADLSGEGMFLRGANANGVLVGQAMLNGVSIPTMWVDDQPVIIADLLLPGPDLLLLNVYAINDSNVMVGEAEDSTGVGHHVLLRPV